VLLELQEVGIAMFVIDVLKDLIIIAHGLTIALVKGKKLIWLFYFCHSIICLYFIMLLIIFSIEIISLFTAL